jgi:predicted RNase H-like nuclease
MHEACRRARRSKRADAVTATVVGVDGCRVGWTVARRDAVTVIDRLEPLVADVAISAIGVDMPIGLPDVWGRSADDAARRFLGRRASTIFPTPPRSLVTSNTYEEANARCREVYGRGLSRQTFSLFPKIRDVDALMRVDQVRRVLEVHPECAFAAMADGVLPPKRSSAGRLIREQLLEDRFGDIVHSRPRGARSDDVLDAFAVLWSVERFARREHIVHGGGELDGRGLTMQIIT